MSEASTADRRHFTSAQKVAILKEHLVEGKPVSAVCAGHQVNPNRFYQWQQQFFERAQGVFDQKPDRPSARDQRRLTELEAKLRRKDEVLAELLEEHVALKKKGSSGFPVGRR